MHLHLFPNKTSLTVCTLFPTKFEYAHQVFSSVQVFRNRAPAISELHSRDFQYENTACNILQ